jgi:glycosyltransferase involved in cell wall biosynthesis
MQVSLIVPAPFSTISGATTYDRRMADCLRALGHAVDVVELPGRFPDADQPAIDAAHTAWARLAADSVPLIDGGALTAFSGLAAALGPRRATALIHHPASLDPSTPEETRQRLHAIEAPLFRAAPRLVVTSEQTADRLVREFGAERDRISVIAPGIGEPQRSHGSQGGPTCAILSVGPLIPRKGHDVLLRALTRLFDLDWKLTIAGAADLDPVHAQGLAALAEELHIAQHVHFAGEVSGDALETLWQSADLFALASWSEGYGMGLAEALRRGLPVAVTSTGVASTLVVPEAGVVCASGDVDQLSKAMRRLIFDRNLRRDVAEAAWQSARALPSWHDQAVRLAAVLAE